MHENRLSACLLASLTVFGGAATAQTTPEERNSPGIYQIKAEDESATGAGTTAAILDTGLMGTYAGGLFTPTHPEFSETVITGYNAIDGSTDVTDRSGHGTHVSGIFAADRANPSTSGMFGPAFDAHLLPVKVIDDNGWGTSRSIADGIRFTIGQRTNAAIVESRRPFALNMSFSSSASSADITAALKQAVNAGMVVAVAAGNDGEANPHYPARHAKERWANGQILAVGSVDAENRMAPTSNKAGDTARFYLVAPGVNVYSTYPLLDRSTGEYGAGFATMSGTSMATPYVTAGLVVIKSAWPYLEAPEIAEILLSSAEDLGDPGTDAVYGRGLIDLKAALSPIGALTASTSSGASTPLETSAVSPSALTAAALRAAADNGQFRLAAFDRYGRDFQSDLAPAIRRARPPANGLAPMLAALDQKQSTQIDPAGKTLRVSRRSAATRLSLGVAGADDNSLSISATDAAGREITAGAFGMGGLAFGIAGELTRNGAFHVDPALVNPFFSLAPAHNHAAIGLPLTSRVRLKLGTLLADSSAPASALEPQLSGRRQSMALAELSATTQSSLWSLSLGRLNEAQSMLGSTHAGALAWDADVGTTVLAVGTAFDLGSNLKVGAQYSTGYTDEVRNGADSLITGYGSVRSESYTVFASFEQLFGKQDTLTLTLSQPLRPVSGTMEMSLPVRAAADGSPVMERRSISLHPAGRELRADLLYLSALNRTSSWFLGGTLRHEPEHAASAPTEKFVGMGLRKDF